MANKDPKVEREYQRIYQQKRRKRLREEFLEGKCCCHCGTNYNLRVDHVDPKTKISSRFWSWSKERREAELAKCQVLCAPCHDVKTLSEIYDNLEQCITNSKLSHDDVRKVRELVGNGMSQASVSRLLEIPASTVGHIITGKTWKHVI